MDQVELQHSQLDHAMRLHGFGVVFGAKAPIKDPDETLAPLEADEIPWLDCQLSEDVRIVTVELRDPDDSYSADELLALAWAYGWPRTAVLHLGSGYLALLYKTKTVGLECGHIFFEPWCSLDTVAKRHLAPGACINGDPRYVRISDDAIEELPANAIAQWTAEADAKDAFERKQIASTTTPVRKPRLYFEDFSQLSIGPERPELVAGLLHHGELSLWVGEPKGGKTANLVYLAYAVASGTPFHGHAASRGLVIYLAAEGGFSTRKRFIAVRVHRGLESQAALLRLVPCPLELGSKHGDISGILNLIREAEKDAGQPAALVIVDTLARATPGMDENDAKGMGEFVANMDYIRLQTGAHVAVVHHFGKQKSKGGRGSSALPAAVSNTFVVEDKTITMPADGQRDHEPAAPMAFDWLPVEIGRRSDGEAITSIVAVPVNAGAKAAFTDRKLSKVARNALNTLQDISLNGRKVASTEWQTEFLRRFYESNSATGKRQFRFATRSLREAGRISTEGGFFAAIG